MAFDAVKFIKYEYKKRDIEIETTEASEEIAGALADAVRKATIEECAHLIEDEEGLWGDCDCGSRNAETIRKLLLGNNSLTGGSEHDGRTGRSGGHKRRGRER